MTDQQHTPDPAGDRLKTALRTLTGHSEGNPAAQQAIAILLLVTVLFLLGMRIDVPQPLWAAFGAAIAWIFRSSLP